MRSKMYNFPMDKKRSQKNPQIPEMQRRGRGRPAQDKGKRRQQVINAALELFTTKGYSETSVADISQKTKMTKRTIYELIGDKEAVFRSVCDELCLHETTFELEKNMQELPGRVVLENIATSVLKQCHSPHFIALNRIIIMEQNKFPEYMSSVVREARGSLNKAIATIFSSLIDKGYIKLGDPSFTAQLFYDIVVGVKPLRILLGQDEEMPDIAEIRARIDVFENGCCVKRKRTAKKWLPI